MSGNLEIDPATLPTLVPSHRCASDLLALLPQAAIAGAAFREAAEAVRCSCCSALEEAHAPVDEAA